MVGVDLINELLYKLGEGGGGPACLRRSILPHILIFRTKHRLYNVWYHKVLFCLDFLKTKNNGHNT